MPGTPIAKSHSLFSVNSFTCRGVISCSASALRSSGRSAGWSSGTEIAVQAKRRRTADLQVQVGGVALHELLQHRLEVEDCPVPGDGDGGGGAAAACGGVSHWDRS